MTVKLIKNFRCAPDGHTVYLYKNGTEVTGVVAEQALKAGAAREEKPTPAPSEEESKTTFKSKRRKKPEPGEDKSATPEDDK